MNEYASDQAPNNDDDVNSLNANRGRHPIHPAAVSAFRSAKSITKPKPSTQRNYGDLSDRSTYAEYAWEFLRRNRFYQQLLDGTLHSASLDEWGYQASPDRNVTCGLARLKPYEQLYADKPPVWEPIDQIVVRINESLAHFRHQRTKLEYPESQMAFAFDLCAIFGPNEIGLNLQSSIATQVLQGFIVTKKISSGFTATAPVSKKPDALKEKLRKCLLVADLLSHPRAAYAESKGINVRSQSGPTSVPQVKVVASLLPDHIFNNAEKATGITDQQKEDRTYGLAGKAREYIYDWKCLNLLTLDQWVISTPTDQ